MVACAHTHTHTEVHIHSSALKKEILPIVPKSDKYIISHLYAKSRETKLIENVIVCGCQRWQVLGRGRGIEQR